MLSKNWFHWYIQQISSEKQWTTYRNYFLCPCCFMPTLGERQNYEICPICSWEDDGQDSDDADVIRGGPNGNYCLEEAQNNFTNYQTMYRPSDKMFTRENKTRALRMKLYNAFCQAMSSHLEQDWENALAIEKQI